MTWNDEIVEEVRRVREEHAKRFNYDISAICADIRQKQIESKRKIISLKKKQLKDKDRDILKAA